MTDYELAEIIVEESEDENEKNRELTQYYYFNDARLCFTYFVGYEITALLGYKNPIQTIKNSVSKCNRIYFRDYPGVKDPPLDPRVILISIGGACEILLKTRKLLTPDVVHMLKKFGIETTNKKCLTKEQQSLSEISTIFKIESHEFQHPIGMYVLDMYFSDYKIIVECDEGNHSSYDPKKEAERVRYINAYLDINDDHWVRFNPDEENYDIAKTVGQIYMKINIFRDLKLPMKRCCTCRQEKRVDQFHQNKGKSDGYEQRCKECRTTIYQQITKNKKKDVIITITKVCPQCSVDHPSNMFTKHRLRQDGLNSICKDCEKARRIEISNMEKNIPEFKKCVSCKYQKVSGEFFKRAKSLDGLYGQCKLCMKGKEKKWKEKKNDEGRLCKKCKTRKSVDNFSKITRGLSTICNDCESIQSLL
jgi:very-short-patch-repair endonuclease